MDIHITSRKTDDRVSHVISGTPMEQQQLLMIEQNKVLTAMAQLATEYTKLLREREQRSSQSSITTKLTTHEEEKSPNSDDAVKPYEVWWCSTLHEANVMSRAMADWAYNHTGTEKRQSLAQIANNLKHLQNTLGAPMVWRFADKWLERMAALGHVRVSYCGEQGKMYWWDVKRGLLFHDNGTVKLPWEF